MITRYIDLDGTLAVEDPWMSPFIIGKPIPDMIKKVKRWIANGDCCIIFTARITPSVKYGIPEDNSEVIKAIERWCLEHLGTVLPVTNIKGHFDTLYDDRASRVIKNSGLTEHELIVDMAEKYLRMAKSWPVDACIWFEDFINLLKGEK
jgi:hypothetical protein